MDGAISRPRTLLFLLTLAMCINLFDRVSLPVAAPVFDSELHLTAVAQHTFALHLELTNRVQDHATTVRTGEWSRSADWCYRRGTLNEVAGKTMGIVVYGRIGQKVGEIAKAFDMRVQFHDRLVVCDGWTPLEQLFETSDVISPQLARFADLA
jgi:lactate dehydrogenase-like 2-hydroxyacid dehydrogenase